MGVRLSVRVSNPVQQTIQGLISHLQELEANGQKQIWLTPKARKQLWNLRGRFEAAGGGASEKPGGEESVGIGKSLGVEPETVESAAKLSLSLEPQESQAPPSLWSKLCQC